MPDDHSPKEAFGPQEMTAALVAEPLTSQVQLTLGKYLQSIRDSRHLSQRDVEKATNNQVSNGYLSQIENDKIKEPSPHILFTLAELYGVDYEHLMERAGYIRPASSRSPKERHGRVATFAEHNLTSREEAELVEYLQWIRNRDRKNQGDKG